MYAFVLWLFVVFHSFISDHQDMMYHFTALLFYFTAFVLEAAVTSGVRKRHMNSTACVLRPHTNIIIFMDFRQYSINVAATVSHTTTSEYTSYIHTNSGD